MSSSGDTNDDNANGDASSPASNDNNNNSNISERQLDNNSNISERQHDNNSNISDRQHNNSNNDKETKEVKAIARPSQQYPFTANIPDTGIGNYLTNDEAMSIRTVANCPELEGNEYFISAVANLRSFDPSAADFTIKDVKVLSLFGDPSWSDIAVMKMRATHANASWIYQALYLWKLKLLGRTVAELHAIINEHKYLDLAGKRFPRDFFIQLGGYIEVDADITKPIMEHGFPLRCFDPKRIKDRVGFTITQVRSLVAGNVYYEANKCEVKKKQEESWVLNGFDQEKADIDIAATRAGGNITENHSLYPFASITSLPSQPQLTKTLNHLWRVYTKQATGFVPSQLEGPVAVIKELLAKKGDIEDWQASSSLYNLFASHLGMQLPGLVQLLRDRLMKLLSQADPPLRDVFDTTTHSLQPQSQDERIYQAWARFVDQEVPATIKMDGAVSAMDPSYTFDHIWNVGLIFSGDGLYAEELPANVVHWYGYILARIVDTHLWWWSHSFTFGEPDASGRGSINKDWKTFSEREKLVSFSKYAHDEAIRDTPVPWERCKAELQKFPRGIILIVSSTAVHGHDPRAKSMFYSLRRSAIPRAVPIVPVQGASVVQEEQKRGRGRGRGRGASAAAGPLATASPASVGRGRGRGSLPASPAKKLAAAHDDGGASPVLNRRDRQARERTNELIDKHTRLAKASEDDDAAYGDGDTSAKELSRLWYIEQFVKMVKKDKGCEIFKYIEGINTSEKLAQYEKHASYRTRTPGLKVLRGLIKPKQTEEDLNAFVKEQLPFIKQLLVTKRAEDTGTNIDIPANIERDLETKLLWSHDDTTEIVYPNGLVTEQAGARAVASCFTYLERLEDKKAKQPWAPTREQALGELTKLLPLALKDDDRRFDLVLVVSLNSSEGNYEKCAKKYYNRMKRPFNPGSSEPNYDVPMNLKAYTDAGVQFDWTVLFRGDVIDFEDSPPHYLWKFLESASVSWNCVTGRTLLGIGKNIKWANVQSVSHVSDQNLQVSFSPSHDDHHTWSRRDSWHPAAQNHVLNVRHPAAWLLVLCARIRRYGVQPNHNLLQELVNDSDVLHAADKVNKNNNLMTLLQALAGTTSGLVDAEYESQLPNIIQQRKKVNKSDSKDSEESEDGEDVEMEEVADDRIGDDGDAWFDERCNADIAGADLAEIPVGGDNSITFHRIAGRAPELDPSTSFVTGLASPGPKVACIQETRTLEMFHRQHLRVLAERYELTNKLIDDSSLLFKMMGGYSMVDLHEANRPGYHGPTGGVVVPYDDKKVAEGVDKGFSFVMCVPLHTEAQHAGSMYVNYGTTDAFSDAVHAIRNTVIPPSDGELIEQQDDGNDPGDAASVESKQKRQRTTSPTPSTPQQKRIPSVHSLSPLGVSDQSPSSNTVSSSPSPSLSQSSVSSSNKRHRDASSSSSILASPVPKVAPAKVSTSDENFMAYEWKSTIAPKFPDFKYQLPRVVVNFEQQFIDAFFAPPPATPKTLENRHVSQPLPVGEVFYGKNTGIDNECGDGIVLALLCESKYIYDEDPNKDTAVARGYIESDSWTLRYNVSVVYRWTTAIPMRTRVNQGLTYLKDDDMLYYYHKMDVPIESQRIHQQPGDQKFNITFVEDTRITGLFNEYVTSLPKDQRDFDVICNHWCETRLPQLDDNESKEEARLFLMWWEQAMAKKNALEKDAAEKDAKKKDAKKKDAKKKTTKEKTTKEKKAALSLAATTTVAAPASPELGEASASGASATSSP